MVKHIPIPYLTYPLFQSYSAFSSSPLPSPVIYSKMRPVIIDLWQLLISYICCSHRSVPFPLCFESVKITLKVCEHVISPTPLLVSPFQISFTISSRKFPRLREVILHMFHLTTSAPHLLVWRLFPAPYTKTSIKYHGNFHYLLPTLVEISPPFEHEKADTIPAYNPVRSP